VVLGAASPRLFSNFLWFHSPLHAAFLIYTGKRAGAVAGAWLVNRPASTQFGWRPCRRFSAFVVLAANRAVVSATVEARHLRVRHTVANLHGSSGRLWWIGDATGVLIVARTGRWSCSRTGEAKAPLSAARDGWKPARSG
jgi:integral membrane sensor domain MASE1